MNHTKTIGFILIATSLTFGVVGCDTSSSGSMDDEMNNNAIQSENVLLGALEVELIRFDDAIETSYSFTNTTDEDVIAFDENFPGVSFFSATELDDGTVRLFKGKSALPGNILALTPPLIEGRLVSPNQTVQGRGIREFPIIVPSSLPEGGPVSIQSPSTVQVCIGFSNAAEVLPFMIGNGMYEQEANLDLQRFACQDISAP